MLPALDPMRLHRHNVFEKEANNVITNITQWYSQSAEDVYAYETFFYNVRGGTYLEMGAHDGVSLSNTKAFHDSLGWKGLLIEANPDTYRLLAVNLPQDLCVNAAICKSAQTVHFVSKGVLSGIWELMPTAFKQRWHPNVDVSTLTEIPCLPLGPLLSKHGLNTIDFFSLDVEGGELAVLKSIDWKFTRFGVVVIEEDGHDKEKDLAVREFMKERGYTLQKKLPRSRNVWFVGSDFVASSKLQK